jgi:hypothetical protein
MHSMTIKNDIQILKLFKIKHDFALYEMSHSTEFAGSNSTLSSNICLDLFAMVNLNVFS